MVQHRMSEPSRPPAPSGIGTRGAHRRPAARLDVVQPLQVADHLLEHLRLRGEPMSPRCGERTMPGPTPAPRQFFRSPPTASTGSRHRPRQSSSSGAGPRPSRNGRAPPTIEADHRVVRRARDRPVVVQERIGHRTQPASTCCGVGQHGFAAEVARGRHHRPAEPPQQQVMQRTVRQHQAPPVQPRRHAIGQTTALACLAHQHDGSLRPAQQGQFVDTRL